MKVATIVHVIRRDSSRPTVNARGNTVYRDHFGNERYVIDFAEDFKSEGWQQFDTDQDAWYFGVWVNPTKRLVLTFAEGDWTLTECPDAAHYNAEIRHMSESYREGFEFVVVDTETGTVTEVRQDRSKFLIPETV